jgi:hypothetical protein
MRCAIPSAAKTISVSCTIATTVAVPNFRFPNRSQMYAITSSSERPIARNASRCVSAAIEASKFFTL